MIALVEFALIRCKKQSRAMRAQAILAYSAHPRDFPQSNRLNSLSYFDSFVAYPKRVSSVGNAGN